MTARAIQVDAAGGSYRVLIGSGARQGLAPILRQARASRVHVITDSAVEKLHAGGVVRLLERAGLPVSMSVVPKGERSKSVRELSHLWGECARAGCDRQAVLLALGGGVVGDLAGFTAASLLRGVRFVQAPTTLLAMVDASVGGKTGINLPEGKNLVGAFHQPHAVVMDLDFLGTLPPREARAGWAEVIKTAAIRDPALFRTLARDRAELLAGDPIRVGKAIERCVRIKAAVVEADERESGLRMILNFGHTLAHSIEAVQRYGGLLHGEAVSVGMAFAAALGEAAGVTERGTAQRLRSLLESYGLPCRVKGLGAEKLLSGMQHDKKRGPKGLRWVLLERIGKARIVDRISPRTLASTLANFLRSEGEAP